MQPERSVAESLVQALAEVPVTRALIARAREARDVLPDALRARGAQVDVLELYETVAEPLAPQALRAVREADYVTFTSSSTVRFFLQAAGEHGGGLSPATRIVSIGPVTSAALREHGLEPSIEADPYDVEGMIAALLADAARRERPMADRALPPVITFLSDYGLLDEFVGVCHGVIARRCPSARVIDLTHSIPRHDVRSGAIVLRSALPFLPAGVHLAIVDPGVSAVGRHARRAVALRTVEQDHLLVGPDNGLLMPAAERLAAAWPRRSTSAHSRRAPGARVADVPRPRHLRAGRRRAGGGGAAQLASAIRSPVQQLRRFGLPTAHLGDGALTVARAARRHVRQPDPRRDRASSCARWERCRETP